jgi:hypothetical protein
MILRIHRGPNVESKNMVETDIRPMQYKIVLNCRPMFVEYWPST